MITFKDTQVTYKQFVAAITRHLEMDALIQGEYEENGTSDGFKGCHVGCTLHDFGVPTDDHAAYERLFGIPQVIARLCDAIHEGLAKNETPMFFATFRDAVKPNQNLSMVWVQFALWMLVDKNNPHRLNQHESLEELIEQVADVYRSWLKTGNVDQVAAAYAARTAEPHDNDAAYAVTYIAAYAVDYDAAYSDDATTAAAYASDREDFWVAASKKLTKLISNTPRVY